MEVDKPPMAEEGEEKTTDGATGGGNKTSAAMDDEEKEAAPMFGSTSILTLKTPDDAVEAWNKALENVRFPGRKLSQVAIH
jgi:hypothetical protein